jgi:hypothetical protein
MSPMGYLTQLYQFTLEKPEVVSAYAAVGVLVLTGVGLFLAKSASVKKIFKQKGGKNSQNIQGEKVEVNMDKNQWK